MALESSPEQPQPLARVVSALRGWVERCGDLWVEGQVLSINRRSGATQYLELRDSRANVSATLTCSRLVLDAAGPLTEGTTIAAWVKPRVFEQRTSLTFECREIRAMGEGWLLQRLEQLKRALQAEGLFDPHRKKRLPFVPRTIGLIAGQGSDAERDVMVNVAHRWPAARFEVRNTLVQGPDAAAQVMAALADLDNTLGVDVVVIARGGGALEDLLPFSDEGLARAVAAARVPVVSAIGHEADSPILDNVADARASTPTDAARLLVPDAAEQLTLVTQARRRLWAALEQRLVHDQRDLDQLRSRPVLRTPLASFDVHDERLLQLRERLGRSITHVLQSESRDLAHQLDRVRTMSPNRTLQRGYAILGGPEGTVSSVTDIDEGDDLIAYVADGEIILEVRETLARSAQPTHRPLSGDPDD